MKEYTIVTSYSNAHPKGVHRILKMENGYCDYNGPAVFEAPVDDEINTPYPPEVMQKYEALLGRPEFIEWDESRLTSPNLVEMLADECAFDQPCRYGCRVEGHAVYCHNDGWLYAPRKCRRTWHTGGEVRDEDCRGYKPNLTNHAKTVEMK